MTKSKTNNEMVMVADAVDHVADRRVHAAVMLNGRMGMRRRTMIR